MDKRMRELVEQAFLTVDGPETFKPSLRQPLIDGLEDLFQEFARLIVKECVNKQLSLAANYEATAEGYEPAFPEFLEGTVHGLKEGAEFIKQNFGVE